MHYCFLCVKVIIVHKKKERKTRSLYTQVGAKDIDDTEVTNMHNYVDGECTKVSARW